MIETATDCIRGRVPDDALADTLSAHLAEHRRVVDGLCVRLPVVASWGAELALRMMVEVRNKLVDAYQQISRMPV